MNLAPLFSQNDAFTQRGMKILYRVIDDVMPMNGAQKRDLPMACRDLSALLTTEREALRRPYWTSPRFTSAYLRYFLPWTLVRLSTLLPGLDLGDIPDEPLILDMGSGPLTLPMALWLSRPDLRARPVTMVVSDTAPHILELGKAVFDRLRTDLDPQSPWKVRSMRASVPQALHHLYAKPGTLWMVTLGNVLNEMEERRAKPGHQLSDRMRELLEDASTMLMENGLIFAVEPGTRQGGRMISHLRKNALGGPEEENGEDLASMALREELSTRREEEDWEDEEDLLLPPLFRPLSPCPHSGPCPMLNRRTTAWCHVNAPADQAPEELRALSARAGLNKESISLSFLLLQKLADGEDLPAPSRGRRLAARIVSDAFLVPDLPGRARYACTEHGLALVPQSAHLPPGALCEGFATADRDQKSRAFILTLDDSRSRPPQNNAVRKQSGHRHLPDNPGSDRRQRKEDDSFSTERSERNRTPYHESRRRQERRKSRPTDTHRPSKRPQKGK